MKKLPILILLLSIGLPLVAEEIESGLTVNATDFDCMLDMEPVRGFYVDAFVDLVAQSA